MVIIPSTSFQSHTSSASNAAAIIVAVKSLPPLPKVVIVPSSVAPMNPVITGIVFFMAIKGSNLLLIIS